MRTPGASNWTPELENELRALWASGKPASQIAALMGDGLTRNSIIGKAHRLGLARRRSPIRPRMAPDERRARRNERQREYRKTHKPEPRQARSNVLGRVSQKKPRHAVVYRPTAGTNDAELVQGWLAQNGGARRFETGASGDELAMRDYLRKRGYETAYSKGKIYLKGRGRPRLLTHEGLVALVDDLRAAEGLLRIAA